MKIFLIMLLAFVMTTVSFGADYNALGFNKYKKGKYQAAKKLFLKSTVKKPKNLYGWYNMARITFILEGKKEIENSCDIATNYEFTALYYLTKATEIDQKRVLELLKRDEPKFNKFKEKDAYKKWMKSLDTKKDAKFFSSNEWMPYKNAFPAKTYAFDKSGKFMEVELVDGEDKKKSIGTWKLKNKKMTIKFDAGKSEVYTIKKSKSYFSQGKKYYTIFKLSSNLSTSKIPTLLLGPQYGDCGEYNF